MEEAKVSDGSLRIKCLIIGYLNLVTTVIDIVFHLLIVVLVSDGFQCDISRATLSRVDWPWLEPLLLILNIGTHGFYALPLTIRTNGQYAQYMDVPIYPRCYPGYLHVFMIDNFIFILNMVWLNYVMDYITGVQKRDLKPVRKFCQVATFKLCMQMMYFTNEPTLQNSFSVETFCFMKIVDIVITAGLTFVVMNYVFVLWKEVQPEKQHWIQSYLEKLSGASKSQDKKENEASDDVTAVVCEKSGGVSDYLKLG